jgi:DNA-binding NarL/FixJ family response regulator
MPTLTVIVADVEERLAEVEARLDRAGAEHGGVRERRALAFTSARDALRCAVALQRAASLKLGVHSGELERRDGDLAGRALLKAARIAALARAGEVLVSGVVRELADLDEPDIWFGDGEEVELRGLPGRHLLLPLHWEAQARPPVRVVIADDAALVRDGVAALLRERGLEVVATAADAAGLHEAVVRQRPDVAVIDIRMPPTYTNEGLVAAERIRAAQPATGVLILSQHVEPAFAERLAAGGEPGTGYLLKERISDADALVDAIRRIARGGCVVDPTLADALVRRAAGGLSELTGREREVLALLAQGLSNRAIADRLVVTGRTVETHVGQIFLKLGLREEGAEHRRVAAVLAYLRAYPED